MSEREIVEAPNAPDYVSVKRGLSWVCICENSDCQAFGADIIANSGYFTGDYARVTVELECPCCKTKKLVIERLAFYKAKWSIITIDNQMLENTITGCNINYTLHPSYNIEDWRCITIITEPIDKAETLRRLWVLNIKKLEILYLSYPEKHIKICKLHEIIQQSFDIPPVYQTFYLRGERVYKIDPDLTSSQDYLSLISQEDKDGIIINFLIHIGGTVYPYQLFVNLKQSKILYHALLIMAYSTEFNSIFCSNIIMQDSNGDSLNFNTELDSLPNPKNISIFSAEIFNPLRFQVKLIEKTESFTFDHQTLTQDFKYLISLYSEISVKNLQFTTCVSLLDAHTLAANDIDSESMILVSFSPVGGVNGSYLKFTDTSKDREARIMPNSNAPDWRIVLKGMSWKSVCKNRGCRAFNEIVLSNAQFGVFDIVKSTAEVKCPDCHKKVVPSTCGFYKSRFKIEGMDSKLNESTNNGEITDDCYFIFQDDCRQKQWNYLVIEVSEIN